MITRREADELAAKYREINEGYDKILVFRAGIDAGFFAEYKYLVHAVIYCLEHKIQLQLYSGNANFGWNKGWTDYFMPFCKEVDEPFHLRYNVHSLQGFKELRRLNPNVSAANLMKWKLKTLLNNRLCRFESFKAYGVAALSTSDIPPHEVRGRISLEQLGIEGNYIEVFQKVAAMLWRFNPQTKDAVAKYVEKLALPQHYAATQIRGGDKVTEVKLYEPSLFVETLEKHTQLRDVLLLTDDYSILEAVRRDFPQFCWHSLCSPAEKGYYNNSFTHTAANTKREQMHRFLAQINAMAHADFFAGSIAVGPSLFLLEMQYPQGLPVDCRNEELVRAAQLSIPDRDLLARKFLKGN